MTAAWSDIEPAAHSSSRARYGQYGSYAQLATWIGSVPVTIRASGGRVQSSSRPP